MPYYLALPVSSCLFVYVGCTHILHGCGVLHGDASLTDTSVYLFVSVQSVHMSAWLVLPQTDNEWEGHARGNFNGTQLVSQSAPDSHPTHGPAHAIVGPPYRQTLNKQKYANYRSLSTNIDGTLAPSGARSGRPSARIAIPD